MSAELVCTAGERRRHLAVLEMVARRDPRLGALVLDHDAVLAYCLPGHGGRIVLTTSALAALDERQLAAVLAHERAHLRGRHHLLLALACGLRRAFPFLTLFQAIKEELSRLTELAADDAAVTAAGRLNLADALLTLAQPQTSPVRALAAAACHTGQRVRRLLAPRQPLPAAAIAGSGVLAATVMAAPLLVAAAPAVAAAVMNCCGMN